MKITNTMLIILIFYFGFLNNALGQVLTEEKNQSPQELYDFHISKKKANNTAGWIALGGGVAMIVGGIAINVSAIPANLFEDSEQSNTNEGSFLFYAGIATTLVSIPLFIFGGKHKKKAEIQLQNGAVGLDYKYDYSGISIAFSF